MGQRDDVRGGKAGGAEDAGAEDAAAESHGRLDRGLFERRGSSRGRASLEEQAHEHPCRQEDAAPGQALAQELPRPGHPPRHRAARPTQLAGGLLVRLAVQATKNQGGAVLGRQFVEFLVKHRLEVAPHGLLSGFYSRHVQNLPFAGAPSCGDGPRLESRAVGDRIEPTAQGPLTVQRIGSTNEDQERCLKRIFGQMPVAQNPFAYPEHQRAVALDQRGEGSLIAVGDIEFQKMTVRKLGVAPRTEQGNGIFSHFSDSAGRHEHGSPGVGPLKYYCRKARE